jgi:hypothetical protein
MLHDCLHDQCQQNKILLQNINTKSPLGFGTLGSIVLLALGKNYSNLLQ